MRTRTAAPVALTAGLWLAGPAARADDAAAPASVAMQPVADDAALCAALRGDWPPSQSRCGRLVAQVVSGLGTAEVWQAATGEQRFALVVRASGTLWMSPPVYVSGSGCGAGHCVDVEITPAVRVIHPHGRAAAVLDLVIAAHHYASDPHRDHRNDRRDTDERLVVCGPTGAGERRCVAPEPGNGCDLRLGDGGTLTRTCRSTEHVELDAPVAP
jgi:hypothetical protein